MKSISRILIYVLAALLSVSVAFLMGYNDPQLALLKLHNFDYKPFVYRALVSWIANVFLWLGLPPQVVLLAIFTLSGVVYVAVALHFFKTFQGVE